MKRFNYLSIFGLHKVLLAVAMALFTIAPSKAQDYLCFSLNGGVNILGSGSLTTASFQVVKHGNPDPIELEYSYDRTTWYPFKFGESEIPTGWLLFVLATF